MRNYDKRGQRREIDNGWLKNDLAVDSAERFCPVIVTDLRDVAVTGFTVTLPFDRNENVIDRRIYKKPQN